MGATLSEFRNLHPGETLWVIGAGPSLNFVDPAFFDDKITIAVSHGAITHGLLPNYVFSNHWSQMIGYAEEMKETVFVLNDREWPSLKPFPGKNYPNIVLNNASGPPQFGAKFDPWLAQKEPFKNIIFGTSSLHGAMHLAAFLGADSIVLVGADNSRLDGKWALKGHLAPSGYPIVDYEYHLRLVKSWLSELFNTNIYSLNPFVNLHLEGHRLNDKLGRLGKLERAFGKVSWKLRRETRRHQDGLSKNKQRV